MTSAVYEALSKRYGALFDDIARGERAREAGRHLPLVPLKQLTDQGFGAITVPVEAGGDGADYQTMFRLLDLAAVDANLAHVWRSHLAFIEYLRLIPDDQQRHQWQRILEGQWGGPLSSHMLTMMNAIITRDDSELRISGDKYTTAP